MTNNVAFLIANQRTGTHLLKAAVASHPMIAAPVLEVFHDWYVDDPANFFHYLLGRIHSDPSVALPNRREETFDDYLRAMPSICGKPNVLLDIKYNSFHHLDGMWKSHDQIPHLINYIKSRKIPVIHLRRENLLRVIISGMRSNILRQYYKFLNEDVDLTPIEVDPDEVIKSVNSLRSRVEYYTKVLDDCPVVYEMLYEDLLAFGSSDPNDLEVNREYLGIIADMFSAPHDFARVPQTRKLSSASLKAMVSNYEELYSALHSSGLQHFIEDSDL